MDGAVPVFEHISPQIYQSENVGFGQSTLYDNSAKLAITSSIRFDNRSDLCKLLNLTSCSALSSNNTTLSDNQLILYLYQKYGDLFAEKILGDFIIALWDKNKQQLLLVSDIMNCRPVYYFNNNNLFAFATTIKALHAIPEIKREPNLIKIANQGVIFDESYIQNEHKTYFDNINYLPGATVLKVTSNTHNYTQYWQPDLSKCVYYKNEDDYVDAFNDIFTQAIKCRISTNSQVGILLSGGLDSSAISAMAANILKQENRSLEAFCNVLPLNYDGSCKDEREYIKLLATNNLHINYIDNPVDGPFDNLYELLDLVESPNYIGQQYIHKAITQQLQTKNVRVLLDGVYGEMGPSYTYNNYFSKLFLTMRLPTLMRESYKMAQIHQKSWLKILVQNTMAPLVPDTLRFFISRNYRMTAHNFGLPLKNNFVAKYSNIISQKQHILANTRNSIFSAQCNQYNFIRYKQNCHPISCYMEKCGVEILRPYLDRRILEFCLSVPDTLHTKNGYPRYLIRRTMRGIMPEQICKRITKTPFIPNAMETYSKALPKAQTLLNNIASNELAAQVIDVDGLSCILHTATKKGTEMDGQNTQAIFTIPKTLGLGVFLSTF